MNDRQLTAALANLGLDASSYPAVALLPLIEVAWADGRIQSAERRLIARVAKQYEMPVSDAWLDRWLKKRPSATAFLLARTVLLSLLNRSDAPPDAPETVENLLGLCYRVAAVAGGLFGLAFTVTPRERACMEDIAQHLRLDPRLPEEVVQIWNAGRVVRPAPGGAAGGAEPEPTLVFKRPDAPPRVPTNLRLQAIPRDQGNTTMPQFDPEE